MLRKLFIIIAFSFLVTLTTPYVQAQTTCTPGKAWISRGISKIQGKQLNGAPVAANRSIASNAFGENDWVFYSLGRGGVITYAFEYDILNVPGADLTVYEVTSNRITYPVELAKVEISYNNINWYPVSPYASGKYEFGATNFDFALSGLQKIKYIRLTDLKNPLNTFGDDDGFDLDAIRGTTQQCPYVAPTPTAVPTSIPTPTDTSTPTPTQTPSPTITPTEIPLGGGSDTGPSPTGLLTPTPDLIDIDFSRQTSVGSPYIFGGTQIPDATWADAWDKLESVGVTLVRKDLFPENAFPTNITIDYYKSNIDTNDELIRWYNSYIEINSKNFIEAKNHGMKTIGILSFSPIWLNTCNCTHGYPKDLAVYKDIMKRIYRSYRPHLDYVEIWNEPTYPLYLQLVAGDPPRNEAYINMFLAASAAIREVDAEINDGKRMKIGGLSAHSPHETDMLQAMVTNPAVLSNLDFVTYHNYNQLQEPGWNKYKTVLQNNNASHVKIYLSEWNSYWDDVTPTPLNGGPESVSYTGRKLVEYLKIGIEIAAYHSMSKINTSRPNDGYGTYGFYRWDGTTATLLDQSKTWRLLSKTMGLGSSQSQIFGGQHTPTSQSIGFVNGAGKRGIVLVNQQSTNRKFLVKTRNINPVENATLYEASYSRDGSEAKATITPALEEGVMVWNITVPPFSVTGFLLN